MSEDVARRLSVPIAFEIRTSTAHDLPLLEWYGLFTAHRALIADAFARQQADEVEMLVADVRGFPVGQLWIDLEKRADERVGILWALRVFPFLCGFGIGRRLLAVAEERLAARGFREAEIGAEWDNPRARHLYESLGYRFVADVVEPYSYVQPDGTRVDAASAQSLLRKSL